MVCLLKCFIVCCRLFYCLLYRLFYCLFDSIVSEDIVPDGVDIVGAYDYKTAQQTEQLNGCEVTVTIRDADGKDMNINLFPVLILPNTTDNKIILGKNVYTSLFKSSIISNDRKSRLLTRKFDLPLNAWFVNGQSINESGFKRKIKKQRKTVKQTN